MANNKPASKAEENKGDIQNVNEALSSTEQFIENNRKALLIALLAVIVVVALVLLYKNSYLAPKQKEAAELMFKGESYFGLDSLEIALNGDGDEYPGFEAIADDYKMTKSGKLANAYAGLCYKGLGDYENAIKCLTKVKTKDIMVSPSFIGAVGDCYVELGQNEKAIPYFMKAAGIHNDLLAPIYLMKAARVYEAMGNNAKALSVYETLKSEYPLSQEGTEVDKYIERVKKSL